MSRDVVFPRGVPVVNMHEAKTQLSRLVAQGEFVIARNGRPVARVTPIAELAGRRPLGFMPDLVVPDDFDELMSADIADLFGATGLEPDA